MCLKFQKDLVLLRAVLLSIYYHWLKESRLLNFYVLVTWKAKTLLCLLRTALLSGLMQWHLLKFVQQVFVRLVFAKVMSWSLRKLVLAKILLLLQRHLVRVFVLKKRKFDKWVAKQRVLWVFVYEKAIELLEWKWSKMMTSNYCLQRKKVMVS